MSGLAAGAAAVEVVTAADCWEAWPALSYACTVKVYEVFGSSEEIATEVPIEVPTSWPFDQTL